MMRMALCSIWIMILVLPAPAKDKTTIHTVKFESYKDGTLKTVGLDDREWELKVDDKTDIVSTTNPKLKLPLKNAFTPINKGTILRVFTEGDGDEMKVVAVQIGQNVGPPKGTKEQTVLTGKFESFKDSVLKITDLDGREWEFKLDSKVDVVSTSAPKTKLPLKNAFTPVKKGAIIRVITEGEKSEMKPVAVQISP
jgi:hypothetical protein